MEDPTDKYTLAACFMKLENLKMEPQKCPDPKCGAAITPTKFLAHFLAEHQNLFPIHITTARPKVLTIFPQKWPLNEVQVLAFLCYEGRNGHAACTPVATKLCKPNILSKNFESYVTSLPMLLMGCRTTTAFLCPEEPLLGTYEPLPGTYEPLCLYAIWIQTCEKTRPLFGRLTVEREGTQAKCVAEFEVQTFGQENCDTVKNMVIKTTNFMRLLEGNINCISDGQEVPLKLEVVIKDYADPWLKRVKSDVATNPYEAAIESFKREVEKKLLETEKKEMEKKMEKKKEEEKKEKEEKKVNEKEENEDEEDDTKKEIILNNLNLEEEDEDEEDDTMKEINLNNLNLEEDDVEESKKEQEEKMKQD